MNFVDCFKVSLIPFLIPGCFGAVVNFAEKQFSKSDPFQFIIIKFLIFGFSYKAVKY
jgi:hypothetical protein